MHSYSKGSIWHSVTIPYNGEADACNEFHSKGSLGPFITVQYSGFVDTSKQGYSKWVLALPKRSVIMAQ
jgi:hypothetical protein